MGITKQLEFKNFKYLCAYIMQRDTQIFDLINLEQERQEHGIELIKFEDGWLSMEHNKFNESHDRWYLHAREFTFDNFKKWFD